ncbi:NUDIX domain-containing protein [Tropicimonas sp. TH_r6]|uniref:NUDIX domain-containing protein n=1 Tax=Tropicimonas sp. TH_r6 TaxID=3082085 RepID=UPI002953BA70|nr:NUDIX domain-containing protein [Tropicimonas sp. TH_r6]MDV7145323.1 NUDIX domain-containing protein [Tropicimonas sp. TH_r6]
MTRFLDTIRPTVRAVILRQGKLLVQVKQKPGMPVTLTLPGGKQEPGETMQDAVTRECFEEVGAEVTVGPLLHVAEVFKPKGEGVSHRVEMLFACEIPADYTARLGPHPDRSQIDTIWACPTEEAGHFRPAFAPHLTDPDTPLYLGVFDG